MSDELDDFALPGGSLDAFLAEEIAAQEESTDETAVSKDCSSELERQDSQAPQGGSTDAEQSTLPTVQDFDPDPERELTLYGAMRVAAEVAVDALRGRMLSDQANAFRSYLISFRNELRS